MKEFLLTLFLTVFLIPVSFSQRNYSQELIDLLEQGRCFEARELRTQYADKLPLNDKAYDLVYKSNMALFFNKPDRAAIYMEELLTNHELILGSVASRYYGMLIRLYADQQRFEEGLYVCDRYITCLKRNASNMGEEIFQNELNLVEKIKFSMKDRAMNEPQIRIERNNLCKTKGLKFNDGEYIRFNAKYNGTPIETWFDTGASAYFTMIQMLADKIGVKVINKNQDSIQMVNNVPTRVIVGMIDSIDLESVKLYNIPVLIFNEGFTPHLPDTLANNEKSNIKAVFNNMQIIMGVPAMQLIGKFEFDWKKRIVFFPENTKKTETNSSSNIFLIGKNIYLGLMINQLKYVGHLDTGDNDFLNLTFPFYEKNKNDIAVDSITQKKSLARFTATGTSFNIPHELVKDPQIYFNDKYINCNGYRVTISNGILSHLDTFDGTVGVNFFKKLGSKVIFDFKNMRIEGKN